jgi:hypothetical protein
MATHSVSASALKYAASSSWTSGAARQGVYSTTRYEGAIQFSGLSSFDMSNINITQIKMAVTFAKSGGASSKYLTFYKAAKSSISGSISSMRGDSIGKLAVSEAYNRSVNLYFNSSTNAALFTAFRDYFMAGNQILIIYVPSTRGTYDGGYCYDYLGITAMTLTFTFDYLQSDGELASTSIAAGSSATMNITAYNTAYSHQLTWTFGSHTAIQTVDAGIASASYTIPLSWLDAIPSSTSGSASVVLDTLDASGTSLGTSTHNFTVTVPESAVQTISSITATPVNSNSVISDWGLYVYGKSQAKLSMSGASGAYGSTIKSYSISTNPSVGSSSASSFTTSTLYRSGTITVTATVTDTRGRTASKTTTFYVYYYSAPYFSSVTSYRCTSDGTQDDMNGTYAYLSVTFGHYSLNGNNAVTGSVVLSQVGGTYTSTSSITSGTAVILGGGSLAVDAVYEATITLTDSVGSTSTYVAEIGSAEYIIHIKNGGKAIGFGMAAGEDETASFGWPLVLSEPLGVDQGGTGGATAATARSNIGAMSSSGGTMTGNLYIKTSLYPSMILQPTYNSTTNRSIFDGSYAGATSFSSWEDSSGDNRRMLEVRNPSAESSLDNAVVLRNVIDGSYYTHRMFHSGMDTPVPVTNGGTAASSAKDALINLGIFYADTLPDSGTDGQICLVPV